MVLPVGDRSERRRTSGSLQHSEPGKMVRRAICWIFSMVQHHVSHMHAWWIDHLSYFLKGSIWSYFIRALPVVHQVFGVSTLLSTYSLIDMWTGGPWDTDLQFRGSSSRAAANRRSRRGELGPSRFSRWCRRFHLMLLVCPRCEKFAVLTSNRPVSYACSVCTSLAWLAAATSILTSLSTSVIDVTPENIDVQHQHHNQVYHTSANRIILHI